ncbi:hypothetical protein [Paraferrimonas sp. SM1919]|uniref:hypothetical protein n=1 Tax=Paraferrimonas sp. SM1919 TaxID=2662263 RepID=UPI0013D777C1|nr:hypothetical protein [Paraferrimonas sp. SM1919]
MNMALLFPKIIDNQYRGHKLALWLFCLLTVVFIGRALIHALAPDGGAQSIATIPLDSFSHDGANAVIGIFALWGFVQLVTAILHVIAIIKYRAMIPLLILLTLVGQLFRLFSMSNKPIPVEGTAPAGATAWPLFIILCIMLLLSLTPRKEFK